MSYYCVRALTLRGIAEIAETKSRKKETQSKHGCLVLLSTTFNIFYLLVDKYTHRQEKRNTIII
jgi:hypothetical protein